MWEIRGRVAPVQPTFGYRVAAVVGAGAMVLLPVIYVGMIIGWGWLVLRVTGVWPHSGFRWIKDEPLVPMIVLVMGAIVLLFMIKPLFHRRKRAPEQREVRREQEPRLFAFIDAIADALGAPRPHHVALDLQGNASAGFTHGLGSLFSRNLTLTLALPLAGALSVQELGGVIAHELGHFRQRAGMSANYLIRVVNRWLEGVVFERDWLDEMLHVGRREVVLMMFVHITMGLVAVTRCVLWMFMLAGRLISFGLSRQMEFDADRAEMQVAGSDAFVATTLRIHSLDFAAHIAHEKQREALQTGQLVDDLPGLILHEIREAPKFDRSIMDALSAKQKGWFQTHPSDRDRVLRAEAARCEGVLQSGAAGAALFEDFAGLSRELTAAYYRDVLQPRKGRVRAVSVDEMNAGADDARRGEEAVKRLFGGVPWDGLKIFLSPADVAAETSLEAWHAVNRSFRGTVSSAEIAMATELRDQLQREHALRRGAGLSSAWVEWDCKGLKLASSGEVPDALVATQQEIARLQFMLGPFRERVRGRLASAIGALLCQDSRAAEVRAEARRCIATLKFIEDVEPQLRVISAHVAPLDAMLEHFSRSDNPEQATIAFQRHTDALQAPVKHVLERSRVVAFPLPHGRGKIMMYDYLTNDVWHGNPLNLAHMRAKAVWDRIDLVYQRVLGRVAALAIEEEEAGVVF